MSTDATTDLYPANKQPFDEKLFKNPTSVYRGTPFWSWNCKLDRQQLLRQIGQLQKMGFGGFHMHARTGLDTEYMSHDFLVMVKACVEDAKKRNMLAWLYDEDRWPSGFAGGLVTKDPQYRVKHLLFTTRPYGGKAGESDGDSTARAFRAENGALLARYRVELNDTGCLANYERLADDAPDDVTSGRVWHAYAESAMTSPWYNNQAYVDVLSKPAIEKFIAVTHERYRKMVGDDFGKTIPAIFTDEPQFSHKRVFKLPTDTADVTFPWTTDLPDTYAKAFGQNLLDVLPELFWELPDGKSSVARWRFHDHVTERFAAAFGDTIGAWSAKNKIALTGHMMMEESLGSQTVALGEAMRPLRGFQLPGIDMLCDNHEFSTAKQAQSVAHQFGRPGVMSELYGVTNWDFDFVGHKAQGNWQAVLGVSVRVPHLAWVSMAGEAKRDYPAAIGYQSPWFEKYPVVEDHFSRVNVVMTRGEPVVRVAYVHPVESYWLDFGPDQQTRATRDQLQKRFDETIHWLIYGQIDFDFISEGLLPSQSKPAAEPKLAVGKMKYDAVVVSGSRTIRTTTLERLEAFVNAGGKVVFVGEIPSLVDAVPSDRAKKLAANAVSVSDDKQALLAALASVREVSATRANGTFADSLMYALRQDGDVRHFFMCNTNRRDGQNVTLAIAGEWDVAWRNTVTGESSPLASRVEGSATKLDWHFPPHGDLLLTLSPRSDRADGIVVTEPKWMEIARLVDPVKVTLSEPNVLLLDQALWQVNDETEWQPLEEILRVDNLIRKRLNLPQRSGQIAQPWTDREPALVAGTARVKFTIQVDVAVTKPTLALENPQNVWIYLDGQAVARDVTGWWTDESIQTVALPALSAGKHELALEIPYDRKTNLEWCYILGDFGVNVTGRHTRIVAPVKQLSFGDWTRQGLPFYGGNVTYHCAFTADGKSDLAIDIPRFKAPLITTVVDGGAEQPVAFAPFRVNVGKTARGSHKVDLTAYGSRINCFGAIHNTNDRERWWGPHAWRSTGDHWAYEYQLRPCGILSAPIVRSADKA